MNNWQQDALRLRLECDGGSRGNPGRAGSGSSLSFAAAAVRGEAEEIAAAWEFIPKATNNVAEYIGVRNGLRLAAKVAEQAGNAVDATTVDVFMDSKLVVQQLTGAWKIKHADMRLLAQECQALMRAFQKVTFTWVPREQNKRADALANRAMDAGESGEWMEDLSEHDAAGMSEAGAEHAAHTTGNHGADPDAQQSAPTGDHAAADNPTRQRVVLIATADDVQLSERVQRAVQAVSNWSAPRSVYPTSRTVLPLAEEIADIVGGVPVKEVRELGMKSAPKIRTGLGLVLEHAGTQASTALVIGSPSELCTILGVALTGGASGSATVASHIVLQEGSISIVELDRDPETDDVRTRVSRMGAMPPK